MISKGLRAWSDFWFGFKELEKLAVMRMILAGTLFYLYFHRQFEVVKIYTDQGIVPKELALQLMPEFNRPFFLLAFWSDAWAPWVHGIFVFSLLLIFLGLSNRVLMFLTWAIGLAFLQRNYSVAFGADVIGGLFLLYLSFTQCCERWTLKNWLNKKLGRVTQAVVNSDDLSAVFYRLIQLQLCVIYMYTGFEKLKGMSWWDGTALWTVFANPQMVIVQLEWLRHFPYVIVGLTFATVVLEVYWPVLVWFKKFRPFVLLAGFLFHMGIGLVMALMPFALVMLSPYVLFLTDEEWARLKLRVFRKSNQPL